MILTIIIPISLERESQKHVEMAALLTFYYNKITQQNIIPSSFPSRLKILLSSYMNMEWVGTMCGWVNRNGLGA